MTQKLTDKEYSLLSLIHRSPDTGDSWKRVSRVVLPIFKGFTRHELIEMRETDDGGFVRLTREGEIAIKYGLGLVADAAEAKGGEA
ncbi:MAG: hypothetical protein WC829_01800 [Hyphomicrobium sp.]|jgi:hypothetical protein